LRDNAPLMNADKIIREIRSQLDAIMATDAAWCRQRLAAAQKQLSKQQEADRLLNQVLLRVDESRKKVLHREASLPVPSYDDSLPITAHREEILQALEASQVVVIAGETGSGKTTQLPKICLEAGKGTRGMIACTQPRRIAARAMAERVSEELGTELGGVVGYQVRFRDRSSPDGYIKFMTDGILLAESLHDRFFDAYDTIIIDEAHERSLNIDFLLGYLKRLLPRRRDLKLIITSATIDTEKFSRHFNSAPVIEVSGRSYPVDVIYQPIDTADDKAERADRDLYRGIADAVSKLNRTDPRGDILVFLSGEREIREAADYLARHNVAHTECLPLYSRLSSAEQRRVFHPGKLRRIILSTNVAETSLTVPRIRFVIDSGLARISRYAHRSRIQRLPIEPISQASANQRSGRCGRLSPGICIRLYSEEDFLSRPEYTEPEILRTSLATVILRMLTVGLGTVEEFPFLDPPAPRMINDAYHLLFELNAVDGARSPTKLGRALVRWPMDVRLARMVVEGSQHGCLEDMMVLAAALSIQDPRERPLEAQAAADDAHDRFSDPKSDFLSLLKLWQYLRKQRRDVSGNQFRKLCRREFLNWQRVLEWFDLYQQLRDQARKARLPLTGKHGDYEQVHRALLSGLLSHVGLKHPEERSYQGARARTFHVFPGSGLFGSSPKWLMSAEIVETSKTWARINAVIKPEWIEQQGRHLLKHHYFDPHWSRRRGAVMAWEQVSLFGLVIVEKRRLDYTAIEPEEARRIFVLEALVRGGLDSRAAFMQHNETVRREVEELEHKRRKRDVLADEHAQFEFFDARIPIEVNSAATFKKWLLGLGDEGRELLYLGHDVLMREDAGLAPQELFPDKLSVGGQAFPLEYHFEPGHERDGVTVTVPLELLNTLDPGQLQWLVPGLLRDKLVALMRQLPKPQRRSLTPVPAYADALLEAMHGLQHRPLLEQCAAGLKKMTGLEVRAQDLDESTIADHFRFRICVTGKDGGIIAQGRDLSSLQQALGKEAQREFMDRQGQGYNLDGETSWVFGKLDRCVTTDNGTQAWPALVDQETAVGLRLFDSPGEAAVSHQEGIRRLLAIGLADKLNYLRKHHGLSSDALLVWSSLGSTSGLISELTWKSLCEATGDAHEVLNEAAFESLCRRVRNEIGSTCLRLASLLNELLSIYGQVFKTVHGEIGSRWPEASEDMGGQLEDLVYPGFLADLEPGRLSHYPRYVKGIVERLEQLQQNPQKDRQRMGLVEPWWQLYLTSLERGAVYDEHLDAFRWLLEEYRVSLFAQRLGTDGKVSEKRLAGAWANTGLDL
jgi:ATP-dependent helicase HrpA